MTNPTHNALDRLQGMDISWCKQPEVGLPKPDAVLFLQLTPEAASERADYGKERYEQPEFQDRVADNYKLMTDDTWKVRMAGDR